MITFRAGSNIVFRGRLNRKVQLVRAGFRVFRLRVRISSAQGPLQTPLLLGMQRSRHASTSNVQEPAERDFDVMEIYPWHARAPLLPPPMIWATQVPKTASTSPRPCRNKNRNKGLKVLGLKPGPEDPSIQIIPRLGPKVYKHYLHWSIWILRVVADIRHT